MEYEDQFNDYNGEGIGEVLSNHLNDRYSSILNNLSEIDNKAFDVLRKVIENEIEEYKEDLIKATETRNMTILQGKILGHRDLLKFLGSIKDIKSRI